MRLVSSDDGRSWFLDQYRAFRVPLHRKSAPDEFSKAVCQDSPQPANAADTPRKARVSDLSDIDIEHGPH